MNLYKYKDNSLYKDRFTPESNWLKVLFTPGRPIQSAELIELQSIIRHSYKLGMDRVIGSLSIVQGLNYTISIQEDNVLMSISEGIIYTEGAFISIPSKDLEFLLEDNISIGVLLNERIITENEDPSLKSNHPYGLPGAHRLLWEGSIVLNNPLAFEIYRYEEGEVIKNNSYPFKEIIDELATFIDSIYASFLLYGLKTSFISIQEPVSTSSNIDTSSLISDINSIETLISNIRIRKKDLESSINQLISSNLSSNLILAESFIQQLNQAIQEENSLSSSLLDKRIALSRLIEKNPLASSNNINLSISPGSAFVKGYKITKPFPSRVQFPYSLETKEVKGARFTNSSTHIPARLTLISSIDYSYLRSNSARVSITFNELIFNNQVINITISLDTKDYLSIDNLINNLATLEISSINITSNLSNLSRLLLKQILELNLSITKVNSNSVKFQIKESSSRSSIRITTYSSSTNITWSDSQVFSSISNVNRYLLPNVNITKITRLVAELKAKDYRITRGNSLRDSLEEDSVFYIVNVYQGDVIYTPGIDYQLDTQQYIYWLDNSPQIGDSYYVDYIYTEELTEEEYSINKANNEITITKEIPIGYGFEVDYLYSIDKKLTVTINMNSDIEVYESSIPNDVLSLSEVHIKGDEVSVVDIDNKIPSISDLYLLSQQVDQHNTIINTLISNQQQYLDSTNAQDSVLATWNIDLSTFDDIDITLTTGTVDIFIQSFNPSFRTKLVSINPLTDNFYKNKLGLPKFLTLPYLSVPYISNKRATRYISSYSIESLDLTIYPLSFWSNNDTSYPYLANNENIEDTSITCSIHRQLDEVLDSLEFKYSVDTYNPLGSILSITKRFFIYIEGLNPNEDGIIVKYDNSSITSIDAIKGTVSRGLCKADSNGILYIGIDLLINEPGNYLVSISNNRFHKSINLPIYNAYELAIYNNLAKYDQRARTRNLDINNEAVDTIYSSINQYFNSVKDFFITKLDLRLREIGPSNLIVGIDQIGLDGTPTSRLVQANPLDYYYSNDSSAITSIDFNYPTLINKGSYSIGIRGEEYKLFASYNQEKDYLTGSLFDSYSLLSDDRLFISKDGSSLSELLYTTLSYEIYRAEFIVGSSVYIPLGTYGITNGFSNITHFSYNSRDVIPIGTLVQYEYKTGSEWIIFKSNTITRLKAIASSIEIRALISSTSSLVSPIINIEGASIALYSDNGTYKLTTEVRTFPFTFNKFIVKVDLYNKKPEDSLDIYLNTYKLSLINTTNNNSYITNEYKYEGNYIDSIGLVLDFYSIGIDKLIARNIRVYIYG